MALSGREIYLILRARDEATRTITRVSSAMRTMNRNAVAQNQATAAQQKQMLQDRGRLLTSLGVGAVAAGTSMIYMGAQGARAWARVTSAAMEYEQQARKTLTQVDVAGGSLERISKMGKRIADTVPVAFEEIQPALYDIFSSIDVGVGEARVLLKQFSKDAVGGQSTLETATRANLAIMNAYKVETKDAAKVSDFMFQLVRKGVGSYDEFAKNIGKTIPASRRAGQEYQTVGAMLAFLTRNGLSVAMSATSAARALESISHPTVVARLEEMGVQVKNQRGEFLPLIDILEQLNEKYGDLTSPQRTKQLYELFKSAGGTIQARRFFDNYFKNADEFRKRTDEMTEAAGAAGDAFETMADSPRAKLQALQNDWMLLKIELGERFMPIAMKILETLNKWIDAFQNLDPKVKDAIVRVGALVTGLTILAGVLTFGAGLALIWAGAINMLGLKALKTTGRLGGLAVAIGGMAWALKSIDSDSTKAEKAVGVLGSTAAGVFGGFMVGGPVGAAIGGAVGLVGGLAKVVYENNNAMETGKSKADEYATAIARIAAASGKAQRAEALTLLQRENMIGAANQMGISTSTLIDALLGEKGALTEVSNAWKANGKHSIAAGLDMQRITKFLREQGFELKQQQGKLKASEQAIKGVNNVSKKTPEISKKANKAISEIGKAKANLTPFQKMYLAQLRHIKGMSGKEARKIVDGLEKNIRKSKPDLNPFNKALKNNLGKMQQDATAGGLIISNKLARATSKAKPDLSPWARFFKQHMNNTQREAANGAGKAADALKKGTGKATPNLMPFQQDLLAMMSATANDAYSGGLAIGNDLESGVVLGFSSTKARLASEAAAAVRGAIASAKAAGKSKSPSREMMKVGKDLGEGLAIGMRKKKGKNKKEASKLVKAIIRELIKGMRSEMPKMKNILDVARNMLEGRKGLSKKERANLLKGVAKATEGELKRLTKVTKRFQKIADKLEKARNKLQNLRQARRSYIQSFSSQLKDFGSFSSFEAPTDVFGNEEPVTLDYIKSQMASRLATVKEFGRNLKKLRQAGYSKAIYDMVVQLGPEAGNEYAKALLEASPREVREMNETVSELNQSANDIAERAGNYMYNAGIKTAEGLVKGLEDKAKDLKKIAKKLGKMIADEIRKALKMKSPSRVGMDIGGNFAASIASGLRGQAKDVSRASGLLASAMQFDPGSVASHNYRPYTPVVGGRGDPATGASKQVIVQQDISVNTQEIDPRRHAAELGWELAARYRV